MKIKVLIVEDNLDIAELMSEMLSNITSTKFEVAHVKTIEAAKLELRESYFDCILLDLLSDSNGLDGFYQCSLECPECPIIIVSRNLDKGTAAVKAGAQDFIPKSEISSQIFERAIIYAIERKKIKVQLQKNEERYRLLTDANFEGITITKDGIFIDSNQQFLDMVGVTLDELVGKDITTYVLPEDKELVMEMIKKCHEKPYEHMAVKRDGTKFPVEIHGRTLPDGLRLTAIRDMTRYKKAVQDLKDSERRYKDLIEVSRAAIYEVDFKENKFIYVNNFMCEQTGYTREEFLSMSPEKLLIKESYDLFVSRLEAMNKGKNIPHEFEYAARTKSGDIVWVVITATYRRDPDIGIVGAKVIAVDITETKKAKQEAKEKEEYIFRELENRIHQWKEELTNTNVKEQCKVGNVNINLDNFENGAVYGS